MRHPAFCRQSGIISLKKFQTSNVGDYCKFEDKGHPYLKLQPLKLEVLLDEPMVHMYHEVVSDEDIAEIKRMASSTVRV